MTQAVYTNKWLRAAALALLCTFGCSFRVFASADNSTATDTVVGAIRWDAWVGDDPVLGGESQDSTMDVGEEVEESLGPNQWHYRLPFYAVEVGIDEVDINGDSQAVMDQEITYAEEAGLDYWAFLHYPIDHPTLSRLNAAFNAYQSSSKKNDINFASIMNSLLGGGATKQDEIDRYVTYFGMPNYQKVLGGRPLVYLFGPETAANSLGGWAAAKQFFQDMENESIARGYGEPYFVVMGSGTDKTNLGFDAVSDYAYSNGSAGGKIYSVFKNENLNTWNGKKSNHIVPLVSTGWDKRTRCENPVAWENVCNANYVVNPTPFEVAAHLQDAVNFVANNPSYTESKAILMYAWNEFDEGGWIAPTLYDSDLRLESISTVLKGAYSAVKDWNFNTNGNFENWSMYFQVSGTVSAGRLSLTADGTDPQIKSSDNLGITNPAAYNKVRIRMKNNTGQTVARVYFTTTADTTWNQDKSVMFPILPNSAFNDYAIDMSGNAGWTGTIKQLRIDPLDPATGAGATVDIDYIRLTD